jgi:glycosyltransferase involved in cell wall biosynthesis
LRIAITADPEIPVPPQFYGGIERIIHLLVCGLVEKGHEVTLFAHGESSVPCAVVPYRNTGRSGAGHLVSSTLHMAAEARRRRFEVIHSFGRLGYLASVLPTRIPKIMSYQRPITRSSVIWGKRLSLGSLHFTACSRQMTEQVRDLCKFHVVYNSVSPASYTYQPLVEADAPLVFLGRLEHIKGTHIAIETAKRTGRKLIIAGNIPAGDIHRKYFEEKVRPHVDGERIQYVGPVGDEEKNRLLGGAAAFLMPILWDEPFGIVMAEALACGTPVIGLRRGSVPEIVDDRINGFVCGSVDEMETATRQLDRISRSDCRRTMEARFSSSVMVEQYLKLYLEVIKQ